MKTQVTCLTKEEERKMKIKDFNRKLISSFKFGLLIILLIVVVKTMYIFSEKDGTVFNLTTVPKHLTNEKIYWSDYYQRIIKDTHAHPYVSQLNLSCEESFYPSMEENMEKVLMYPVIQPMKKKHPDIFGVFDQPYAISNKSINFPVFVTAASSNHYYESLAMIKSVKDTLMPRYKGLKLVFFDIGLTAHQRRELQTFCNCEIRIFPFDKYPSHVSTVFNYAWKPLIIYTMLKEYDFVTWADASMSFHGTKEEMDTFFNRAKQVGILLQKLGGECRSIYHTKKETFKYLNESDCLFEFHQLEATFITIWKTTFVWKYVIQPWIACALTENCMSHYNPMTVLNCNKPNTPLLHRCHRFDQSVLSIILQRLFNVNHNIVAFNSLPIIGKKDGGQTFHIH